MKYLCSKNCHTQVVSKASCLEKLSHSNSDRKNTCIAMSAMFNLLKHTHTHTHTQPFYGSMDFVRNNPGELISEETFTHSHLSWSSIVPYPLPPSNTIHGILSVQSTCLAVFSTISLQVFSWPGTLHFKLHTFLHQSLSFRSTCLLPSQPVLL